MEEDLLHLPVGNYLLTIEKWFRKASPKQFGWLYSSIYPQFLIAANNAGEELSPDDNYKEVDNFCKTLFANKTKVNRQTGELVYLPKNKREFLTVDHMAYCNLIRSYSEDYYNHYIPEPDVDWKKHREEIQKMLEK